MRDWLGDDRTTLDGFSWGCGENSSRILLWSEPYLTTLATGEKVERILEQNILVGQIATSFQVAILLMDTQVAIGSQSMKDFETIFTLSTLISSVQVSK